VNNAPRYQMTIGIGLICKDGIALGSDSLTETEGNLKRHDLEKISLFEFGDLVCGIVQAGRTAQSMECVRLTRAATEAHPPKTANDFVGAVTDAARLVRRHSSSLGDPTLTEHKFDLIVAIWGTQPCIYTLNHLSCLCTPEPDGTAFIGSGDTLADYLLRGIPFNTKTVFEGVAAAAYAVEVIGKRDRYCDAPTRAAVLVDTIAHMIPQERLQVVSEKCREAEQKHRMEWSAELADGVMAELSEKFKD